MAKGKTRKPKSFRKKERQEFEKRMQRRLSGEPSKLFGRIAKFMRQGDHKKALFLVKPLLNRPILIAYLTALDCCTKLRDVETAERIFKKGINLGLSETELAAKMLAVYFQTNNFDKLITLYNRIKQNKDLRFEVYITMISFFGTVGDVEKAREIYETALTKASDEEQKTRLQNVYVKHVLSRSENIQAMIDFVLNLNERKALKPFVTVAFLDALYAKRYYDLAVKIYPTLNDAAKNIDTELIWLNFLLKLKRFNEVLRKTKALLKDPEIQENPNICTALKIIRAYALKDSGQIKQAQREFEMILLNLSLSNPLYPRALCGYIFTEPELAAQEKEKYRQQLIEALRFARNPRLRNDIQEALEKLK